MDREERSRESSFIACSSSWSEFAVSGGPESKELPSGQGREIGKAWRFSLGEGEVCVALVWPS